MSALLWVAIVCLGVWAVGLVWLLWEWNAAPTIPDDDSSFVAGTTGVAGDVPSASPATPQVRLGGPPTPEATKYPPLLPCAGDGEHGYRPPPGAESP